MCGRGKVKTKTQYSQAIFFISSDFFQLLISNDRHNIDRVVLFRQNTRKHQIEILSEKFTSD